MDPKELIRMADEPDLTRLERFALLNQAIGAYKGSEQKPPDSLTEKVQDLADMIRKHGWGDAGLGRRTVTFLGRGKTPETKISLRYQEFSRNIDAVSDQWFERRRQLEIEEIESNQRIQRQERISPRAGELQRQKEKQLQKIARLREEIQKEGGETD